MSREHLVSEVTLIDAITPNRSITFAARCWLAEGDNSLCSVIYVTTGGAEVHVNFTPSDALNIKRVLDTFLTNHYSLSHQQAIEAETSLEVEG
ncbi:hypothetical protein IHQ56_02625 [Methylobacillus flagellatus]|uniref:hypothetical protein n=1 Tax=Methylobacillus flagellatus TaxID=405 RepID=UPI002853C487|nr:hypothetical protein [Methylobacillus flagellatus]MDR5170704.1 hypothetical protein [Methylobacillus flagellatus]